MRCAGAFGVLNRLPIAVTTKLTSSTNLRAGITDPNRLPNWRLLGSYFVYDQWAARFGWMFLVMMFRSTPGLAMYPHRLGPSGVLDRRAVLSMLPLPSSPAPASRSSSLSPLFHLPAALLTARPAVSPT